VWRLDIETVTILNEVVLKGQSHIILRYSGHPREVATAQGSRDLAARRMTAKGSMRSSVTGVRA
jgi:hypothetical protein